MVVSYVVPHESDATQLPRPYKWHRYELGMFSYSSGINMLD